MMVPAAARSTTPAGRYLDDAGPPLLAARGLRFGYAAGWPVVDGVDLSLDRGQRLALVGPNGAGKTTLLRLLGGTLAPQSGIVAWEGRPLHTLSRRELARRIAVVPQTVVGDLLQDLTVEEVASIGRTPHAGWLGLRGETAADRAAVAEALRATGADYLADRPLAELSGGERQRALLAMALAQQPQLLLLDEPTRHLDPHHQAAILDLIVELTTQRGLAVIAAMHDLNLASCYFPRVVLMHQGRLAADGPPAAVFVQETVSTVYGSGLHVLPHPDHPDVPLVLPGLQREPTSPQRPNSPAPECPKA